MTKQLKSEVARQVIELSLVVQSVRIFGFHPEDPGSIPGRGAIFAPTRILHKLRQQRFFNYWREEAIKSRCRNIYTK